MWSKILPIPSKTATFVITHRKMHCFDIARHHKQPFKLIAHETIDLPPSTFGAKAIFNMATLSNHTASFLKQHNLQDANVAVAFISPLMKQRVITCPPAQFTSYHETDESQETLAWQHLPLSSLSNESTFYVCGLSPTISFQWKMLALAGRFNLSLLTSDTAALLHLYKMVYADAFNQRQLTIHMEQTNNSLMKVFTPDLLTRILQIPNTVHINLTEQLPFLLTACGLFIFERNQP